MSEWAEMGRAVLHRPADGPDDYSARLDVAGYPYLAQAHREVSADRDVIVLKLSALLRPRPEGSAA